jgi:monoamine oxidase
MYACLLRAFCVIPNSLLNCSAAVLHKAFIINGSEMASSILVIGAGATGLLAARRLSASGFSVTVLEAAPGPGGRMQTLSPPGFSAPVEGGAEFIHGDLPISLQLAAEAGVALEKVHAHTLAPPSPIPPSPDLSSQDSRSQDSPAPDRPSRDLPSPDLPSRDDGMSAHWDELMKEMDKIQQSQQDLPLADFLAARFSGDKYSVLRDSVRRYAEGYDLADLHTVSTLALYKEWLNEHDEEAYRPEGGYQRIVHYLVDECNRNGCVFHFSSPAATIGWQTGRVEVTTADGRQFSAQRLIITASLGALKFLRFSPAIPEYLAAAGRIGYGTVVKILLEFKSSFWKDKKPARQTLFILSDQPVPVWWTPSGDGRALITGWLAGRPMAAFLKLDRQGRVDCALASLAQIFSIDRTILAEQLTGSLVLDWKEAPFILGGYSFDTVLTPVARAFLSSPVADTLFFAGEALYEGLAPGTVEAAFSSGLAVAEKIIAQL